METVYNTKQLCATVARIRKPEPAMVQLMGALQSIAAGLKRVGEFDDVDELNYDEMTDGDSETSVTIQSEKAVSIQIDKVQLRRDNLDAQWDIFVDTLKADATEAIQAENEGALVMTLRHIILDAHTKHAHTKQALRARAMLRNMFKFLCVEIPRSSQISFAKFTTQTTFVRALSQVCSDNIWTDAPVDAKTVRRSLAIHYEAVELIVLYISAIDADINLSRKLRFCLGHVIEFGIKLLVGAQRKVQDQFRVKFSRIFREKNSELSSSRFLNGLCKILTFFKMSGH
eukprot:SAG11_NODE_479_length_9108_cov_3.699856_3_plen_286_part_00